MKHTTYYEAYKMLIGTSNGELVNLPSYRKLDSRGDVVAPRMSESGGNRGAMPMLFSPNVENIADDTSDSLGRATVGFKGKWDKSRIGWLPNPRLAPGCADVLCESASLAGVSIISCSAGDGGVSKSQPRRTSRAAGTARVSDYEVDDEVAALPRVISNLEVRHIPTFVFGGAGGVEFRVVA